MSDTWRFYRGYEIYLVGWTYYVVGISRGFTSIHTARAAIDERIG